MVKEFLSQRGVRYTLKNLSTDAEARREFVRLGYRLPPVTVIDGEAVEGYDPARLEPLLDERWPSPPGRAGLSAETMEGQGADDRDDA